MSWLGDALVEHDEAVRTDRESTVFAMVAEREQIQWESNVDFRVASIGKHEGVPQTGLTNGPEGPDNPFEWLPKDNRGGPGRPIRSGPPKLTGTDYNQLYKATFEFWIPGEANVVVIDPDVYCDFR